MDNNSTAEQSADVIHFPVRNFHGAAIIDENGIETPITETMVDDAIDQLINYLPSWLNPLSINRQ